MPNRWAAGAAWSAIPFWLRAPVSDVRQLCQARRAGARYAGVVRSLVVRNARRARRDRVLGVVLIEARCARVVPCRCGTLMLAAGQRLLNVVGSARGS